MSTDVREILDAVRSAPNFREGAGRLLAHLLERAAALHDERLAGDGTGPVRAMLHLRPGDGYRGLVVLERGAASPHPPSAADDLQPSTRAWRLLQAHPEPLCIDVNLGEAQGFDGRRHDLTWSDPDGRVEGTRSRVRLLRRGATHVLVLPLRTPEGLAGMVTLEASARGAMGTPYLWPEVVGPFQLALDAAAPWVAALPMEPEARPPTDEEMPVLGPTMAGIVRMVRVFAQQDETLLIRGETGTGKSRLARWCHGRSRRAAGPFVVADLHTIPESMQLAELFGWRRGAFTGATADQPGYVARAEGGTLFLDEVDKLSPAAQSALLALLEERRYRVLGDPGGPRIADVRFIVGTNADLAERVRAGAFRQDLYYRINVLPIALPPLRQRRDEIPAWAAYLLARRHRELVPEGTVHLAADAELVLQGEDWPGNLRQLDNVLRRAWSMALVEHGGLAEQVVVRAQHVRTALDLDRQGGDVELLGEMRRAAAAFVRAAEARRDRGGLHLDHAAALRGLVLAMAVQATGSREEAFRLLGRGALLRNRNHHKVLQRERQRLEGLCQALGIPLPPDLLGG